MPRRPNYDRDELIDRARDLFWERGWAGTSLKDLERVLQMKPGSFYAAFGSKDALFALALKKYAHDGRENLKLLAQSHGPLEALQRLPALVIGDDSAPAKACMLSKVLLELHAHNHPMAHEADALLMQMEAVIADLFQQAQSSGQMDAQRDPRILARKYQSDLLGLRVMAERDSVDAKAIAAQIAEGLGSGTVGEL